jgi:hypothetical protein
MSRALLRALLVALLFVVASHGNAQTEPVHGRYDAPDEVGSVEQLIPRVAPAPYFQIWDWWFWTEEQDFIHAQVLISSFGFGIERQGSIRMTAVRAGAVSHGQTEPGVFRARRGFEGTRGEWTSERDRFDLTLRDCFIRGDGETFEIALYDNTVKLEATLTMDAPLYRPGDGRIEFGWDRAAHVDETYLPRYRAEGRMSLRPTRHADEDWQPMRAVGYGRHSRLIGFPFTIMQQSIGFRALRPDGLTILFESFLTPDEFGAQWMPWVLVLLDGEIVFESSDVTWVPTDIRPDSNPPSTYPVPWAWDLEARSGEDTLRLTVHNAALVQKDSILSRVSRVLRAVMAQRMNPMDYDFAVDYAAWLTVDGVTAHVAGAGWQSLNFPR